MHIFHTNIPVSVFGGEVRPEPRPLSLANSGIGAFGAEVRPEVRAVEMRT